MTEIHIEASETTGPKTGAIRLADDLLEGAEGIAEFLFGDAKKRRRVYHLAENKRLPVFRLGAVLCARKSTLMDWIAKQETIIQ